jgi:hypothetical protein
MKEYGSSEILVTFYMTTQSDIPKTIIFVFTAVENLKSE